MKISDDILISYILGEATVIQQEAVEKWRAIDIANERRFTQFKVIWDISSDLNLKPEMDAQASLQRFNQQSLNRQAEPVRIVRLSKSYNWLQIAAAVLLLAGGALFYILQQRVSHVSVTTAKFEVKTDTLSDGSIITLNQNTVLNYPNRFKGRQRSVLLSQGEAFFNVAHKADQPFIINSGKVRIQVLGTSFNVKSKNGRVEIIVETGLVAVSRSSQTIFIRPGQKLVIGASEGTLVKTVNHDRLYQYYRTHEFVANNTPLTQMISILNEAYDSHIIIQNRKLDTLQLNTTFKNESLENVLDVISHTFNISVIRTNNTILLK
ncbi:FecR family protein [Mucilaginibacter jinjuensis]|uniref:FecR domain-containing protein n=1 Tax=Mucilaginibacter jinjuensis TaxID=1176721 RepID=A0ABY7TE88_9SPHI|nr:FecR domain-containing protein [Mucilaginibacter jinjuensis]WCT14365.1 FecR domain-containing protein [Mucilaginibacter jinjuensis]